MQIYKEAESNANAFAFACLFSPSETGGLGLMDTTGETGDASLTACMAEAQQYFCRRQIYQKPKGVNRISGEAEYRRSRELHGVPRKERTGARLVPEAGVRGKVLRFHGKSIHFPPPRRQMYACRTSMTENTVSCFMLPGWNCL